MAGCRYKTTGPLLVAAVLLFVLAGCGEGDVPGASPDTSGEEQASKAMQPKVIAMVDHETITDGDVAYRIRVEQAYGGKLTEVEASIGLIKDTLEYVVARHAGAAPTAEELDLFARQVTKQSKAPELLKQIKQVFGGETRDYLRLYLRPILVNIKLHDWFNRSERIHASERKTMQRAYALIWQGQSMESVGKQLQLHHAKQTYGAKKQQAPDALKAYFPQGLPMMTEGFRKVLDGLKPGEISSTILEDESGFRIVRLISKGKDEYKTEELFLPKKGFDDWFRERLNDISVRVPDAALRKRMLEIDPSLPLDRGGDQASMSGCFSEGSTFALRNPFASFRTAS